MGLVARPALTAGTPVRRITITAHFAVVVGAGLGGAVEEERPAIRGLAAPVPPLCELAAARARVRNRRVPRAPRRPRRTMHPHLRFALAQPGRSPARTRL